MKHSFPISFAFLALASPVLAQTPAQLEAQITALQVQVATLQQELGNQNVNEGQQRDIFAGEIGDLNHSVGQLKTQFAGLQATVSSDFTTGQNSNEGLYSSLSSLWRLFSSVQVVTYQNQNSVTGESSDISALKGQMANILTSNIWAINPFVHLSLSPINQVASPIITFNGVNLMLTNGMEPPT
jgi:hypothetical protein